jgi:predicted DNA-binding protein
VSYTLYYAIMVLTIRLTPALNAGLAKAARAARQNKSTFMRDTLAERLAETEDLRIATRRLRALATGKTRLHSLAEVKHELGIDA